MSILESQLETWSKQGAIQTPKKLHEDIRRALKQSWSSTIEFPEIYLQGSYKNDTNIYGDSDVDVVVQSNKTYYYDVSSLPNHQQNLFQSSSTPATYDWDSFRSDVLVALRRYFGDSSVTAGDNCLIIKDGSSRLTADVLVCFQYRKYINYFSSYNENFIEGVHFFSYKGNRWITNFPDPHYKNGVQKNAQFVTNGWFKPTVRIFKNARTYLINKNVISSKIAPSYFLQCLLYNVPDRFFGYSYNRTFLNILTWLYETDISNCICQNGQIDLFGNTPEQWSLGDANILKNALINLWNNW